MGYGRTVNPFLQGLSAGLGIFSQAENIPAQHKKLLLQNELAKQKLASPGLAAGGLAGQYSLLNYIGQRYGQDSPQYQQLSQALQKQQTSQGARANYMQTMAQSVGMRYAGTLGRSQIFNALQGLGYPTSLINTLNDQQKGYVVANKIPYRSAKGIPVPQEGVPPAQIPAPAMAQGAAAPQMAASPQMAPSALSGGMPSMQGGMPSQDATPILPPHSPEESTPESAPEIHSALEGLANTQQQQTASSIMKQTMTVDQQKRMTAAARALPILQMMSQNATQALQYAGMAGKSKKLGAQLRQANDPRYVAYKKYKQAQAVAQQDVALGVGIPATDEAFKQYAPLFKIDTLDMTPAGAMQLFNNINNILHKEMVPNLMNLSQIKDFASKYPTAQVPSAPTLPTQMGTTVAIIAPDGSHKAIPANQVEAALKAGGRRA